jgi:hypothetical protein
MSTRAASSKQRPPASDHALSLRVFALLLRAYPNDFRREYGPHMVQVFRDQYRAQSLKQGPFVWLRLWLDTLRDFFQSVAKEHFENRGKDNSFMTNLRKDAMAVLGCLSIIIIAFFLLDYGRRHEVSSILTIGYVLDALILAGLVGNFIVFLLVKTTRFNPLRTAFWVFLIVNALPAIGAAFIGLRLSPQLNVTATLVGYLVSFLLWFGLHWAWALSQNNDVASTKSR